MKYKKYLIILLIALFTSGGFLNGNIFSVSKKALAEDTGQSTLNATELKSKATNALFNNSALEQWKARTVLDKLCEDNYFYMSKVQRIQYIADNIKVMDSLSIIGEVENIFIVKNLPEQSFKLAVILNTQYRTTLGQAYDYWAVVLKNHMNISNLEQDGKKYWTKDELDLLYNQQFAVGFEKKNRNNTDWTNGESGILKTYFDSIQKTGRQATIEAAQGILDGIGVGMAFEINQNSGKIKFSPERATTSATLLLITGVASKLIHGPPTGFTKIKIKSSQQVCAETSECSAILKTIPADTMGASASIQWTNAVNFWNNVVRNDYQIRKVITSIIDNNALAACNPNATFNDLRLIMSRYWDGIPQEIYAKAYQTNKASQYIEKIKQLDVFLRETPTNWQAYGLVDSKNNSLQSLQTLFNFPSWYIKNDPNAYQYSLRMEIAGGVARQAVKSRNLNSFSDVDVIFHIDNDSAQARVNITSSFNTYIKNNFGLAADDISFGYSDDLFSFIKNAPGESISKLVLNRKGNLSQSSANDPIMYNSYLLGKQDAQNNTLRYIIGGRTVVNSDYTRSDLIANFIPEQNITRMIRFMIEFDLKLESKSSTAMLWYDSLHYDSLSSLTDIDKLVRLATFYNRFGKKNIYLKIDSVVKMTGKDSRSLERAFSRVYLKDLTIDNSNRWTWREVYDNWDKIRSYYNLQTLDSYK